MQRQINRSRFFVSSWYAGAGGLINIFSVKPYKDFHEIKSIYIQELKKLVKTSEKALSLEERKLLRKNIEIRIKKENWKKLVLYFSGIIIFSLLISVFLFFIHQLYN